MALCVHANSLQSCPILCDPRDCSPPGSSVHGILQARILEWVAMPSSRGSSQPRDQTHVSSSLALAGSSLPLAPPGKPINAFTSHKQRRTCLVFHSSHEFHLSDKFSSIQYGLLLHLQCTSAIFTSNF